MKNSILICLISSMFLLHSSCQQTVTGEGPVVEKEREVEPFNKIAVNTNAHVIINNSPSHMLKIKAQQNIHDVIVTRIDGKTLVITTKGIVLSDEPIVIEASVINPEAFEMNGSGEIRSAQPLSNEVLDLEVNGSGLIDIEVQVNKLTASVSGSGVLKLRGNADDFKMQINGSGNVDALNLLSQSASATLNGSGEASLNVVTSLKSTINGSGKIIYKGSPDIKNTINGSGSIVREDGQ